MLTIRPTKRLAARLGILVPNTPPKVTNRVADWCAHEFMVGRYRHLFFFNTASIYPVVTLARGVTDESSLIERLIESLKLNLVGTKVGFQFERWIAPALSEVQFAPIPDRSTLGAMNDLIFAAKWRLGSESVAPVELSEWLAVTPLKTLGYGSPHEAFASLGGKSRA